MRRSIYRLSIAVSVALVATADCSRDDAGPTELRPLPQSPDRDAAMAPIQFTVGPLTISGIDMSFPGGRWHFREATLSGPVSGDLTGTAEVTLNANLDALPGSGPEFGTMSISTTDGGEWHGSITGDFQVGDGTIQLFGHAVLQSPANAAAKVSCIETTPTSETLACTGTLIVGHD
jgi:hypothetical protein